MKKGQAMAPRLAYGAHMSASSAVSYRPRSGMVSFAGSLFVLAGAFNIVDGVVGLTHANDRFFDLQHVFLLGLQTWSIAWLVIGGLQVLTGLWILMRRPFGIGLGVFLAMLNAVAQLMFLRAYPVWAVAIIAVDLIVIWSLCSNSDEFA